MDKENASKDMIVRVPPSLYLKFQKKCNQNYKKVSEVVRELMLEYIRREK